MITLIVPFHLVFTEVLAGGYILLAFISEKETGKGFTKLMNAIFMCFLLLSYLFGKFFLRRVDASSSLFTAHSVFFAALLVLLPVHAFTKDAARALVIFKACVLFVCVDAVVWMAGYFNFVPAALFLRVLFFVSIIESSLFLGAATLGMLFGHWYLVKPKMDLSPFKKITLVFLAATAAQFFMAALYVILYFLKAPLFDAHLLDRLFRFADLGIFFMFRFILGTLTSLVIAYLTYTTLSDENIPKINRTRAATGLLYMAILSAFTGELLGKYLFWITKIPL